MSKFRHTRPIPDPAALEAFARGADSLSVAPMPAAAPAAPAPAKHVPHRADAVVAARQAAPKPRHIPLRLPPSLADAFQIYCVRNRTSMQRVTEQLIRDLLQRENVSF